MKKLVLALVILSLVVAAPVFAEYDYVLGKVPYTFEHAYHQSVCRELTEYAAKMYNAEVRVVDGEANNETTLSAVENLIAQGVDGIALHTGDAGLMTTAIKLAHDAGIPIVTTLIRPTEKLAPHIQPQETPSSFQMGQIAATQWLKAHPDTPCKVAMLNFGGYEQIQEMRTGAFFNGVKSVDPNAEMVTMLNGYGSTIKSMEVTLDILQGNPEVNIIFGANDEMALGALAACEQLGRGKMDNGTPLTEVIAGLDGNEAAMLKIYDPNSSFKMTHGAVKDNAHAEADTLIKMIKGDLPMDHYIEIKVLSPVTDFWGTPIEEAQLFLEDNFFFEKDLKELVNWKE
jgi:ribose transport system substrate-binding protein